MEALSAAGCLPGWTDAITRARVHDRVSLRVPGCAVDEETRTIRCEPENMRSYVERRLHVLGILPTSQRLSIEVYSLARNIASEAGSGSITEQAGIGEAAINRAKADGVPLLRQMLKDGRWYGRQSGNNPAVATSRDPSWSHIVLAELVLAGRTGNFIGGATHYYAPKYYSVEKALELYDTRVRNWGHSTIGLAWIGPRPGVDPQSQFFMAPISKSDPRWAQMASVGRYAIQRKIGPTTACATDPGRPWIAPTLLALGAATAGVFFYLSRTGRIRWFS